MQRLALAILWQTVFVSVASHANAQGSSRIEQLRVVSQESANICRTVSVEGSNYFLKASGQAEAQVNGIARRLIEVGMEGSVDYFVSEFKGFLQKDLAEVYSTEIECRKQIAVEIMRFLESEPVIDPATLPKDPVEDFRVKVVQLGHACERNDKVTARKLIEHLDIEFERSMVSLESDGDFIIPFDTVERLQRIEERCGL